MSSPGSIVHVMCNVPLNNTYEHTLYFDGQPDQFNYFQSKTVQTFTQFTYLRPERIIKVNADYPTARNWCYLSFTNGDGKYFYHFINKVEYINDATVALHIELDVMQTYMFGWGLQLQQCFVERMHTKTDNMGEHTVEEGLETGPLYIQNVDDYFFNDLCVLISTPINLLTGAQLKGNVYNGVFSGYSIMCVDKDNFSGLRDAIQNHPEYFESVVAMWMYPKDLIQTLPGDTGIFKEVYNISHSKYYTTPKATPANQVGGHAPVNNKLFTYPYSMLYVTNNMGGSAVYRKEHFNQTESASGYKFKIGGGLSPDAGIMLSPMAYRGAVTDYESSLSLGAFPSCAWASDTYKLWLAQNQNQQETATSQLNIQAGIGAATALVGAVTGNVAGMVGGGGMMLNAYNQVQTMMAQKADLMLQPPQSRGHHSSNLNISQGICGFRFTEMEIGYAYALKIDRYFSRYGYKVNSIEVPSLKNRQRFTYLKTVGCFVTGNFGSEDQRKIQNIFDKGITIWSDHNSIGDYTSPNPCL